MSSLRAIVFFKNIPEIMWHRLKSIFLYLYLTGGLLILVEIFYTLQRLYVLDKQRVGIALMEIYYSII